MLKAERLLDCRNAVGECPVWDAVGGRLLWVDIGRSEILALDMADGRVERRQRATPVGSIALANDGGLIAGTAEGFVALRLGSAEEQVIAPVLAGRPDLRMNDGACDRQGRFWSGSMARMPDGSGQGTLYRLAGDVATPILDGFVVQNGLAWSPDGRTMYVSDSHVSVQTVWAMDFDVERGVPSNRRVFATGATLQGRPDGAAVDADGCYWIAASDGGRIVRLTPDGREDAAVIVPTANPTNFCFGGPELRTMLITSLQKGPSADAEAGNLFVVETPFQGLPETLFGRHESSGDQQ